MEKCFALKPLIKTQTLGKHRIKVMAIKLIIKTSKWFMATRGNFFLIIQNLSLGKQIKYLDFLSKPDSIMVPASKLRERLMDH